MKQLSSFLFLFFSLYQLYSQQSIPIILASSNICSIREGDILKKNGWQISPNARPDVYEVFIKKGGTRICFLTDKDSISFSVKPGNKYPFIILLNGKDSAYTEIRSREYIEPALFTKDYIKKNKGKIITEIPEVYELVNIIFALTPEFKKDRYAVERNTNYYRDILLHFEPFANERVVNIADSLLKSGLYHRLKMDAYAYEFNKKGEIVQSPVYDRISRGTENTLRLILKEVQAFSQKTGFQNFYKKNTSYYNTQIKAFKDSIDVSRMIKWLNFHFPNTRYDAFKIIWSPLVTGMQEANWFENNGFKEAQQHVNFPYAHNFMRFHLSKEAMDIKRGDIVFTEMNHAFINEEANKEEYKNEITSIFKDLSVWGEKEKAAKWYPSPYYMFNEYMNWGLVTLRYYDFAPKNELDSLTAYIDRFMLTGRGFTKFPKFNAYLLEIYKNRKPNEKIADLYPRIIAWFKEEKNM